MLGLVVAGWITAMCLDELAGGVIAVYGAVVHEPKSRRGLDVFSARWEGENGTSLLGWRRC